MLTCLRSVAFDLLWCSRPRQAPPHPAGGRSPRSPLTGCGLHPREATPRGFRATVLRGFRPCELYDSKTLFSRSVGIRTQTRERGAGYASFWVSSVANQ